MKENGLQGSLPAFARDILRYLTEHPDATDTVQGILQWWLHEEWAEGGTEEVQKILDLLVRRGWLTETEIPSPKIYGINKTRLAEIRGFLTAAEKKKS